METLIGFELDFMSHEVTGPFRRLRGGFEVSR